MFSFNLRRYIIISKEDLNIKDSIITDLRNEVVGYRKAYEGLSSTYNTLDTKFNTLSKKYNEVCVENVGLASEVKKANKNLIAIRKESDGQSQRKTPSKTNREKNQNSRTKNKKPAKKA